MTAEVFAYAYDAVGNRTALTSTTPLSGTVVTTYTYDIANRLTSVDGVTYTWDARGNLTHDGTFTYTYNSAGRLVRAESITATITYTYNADGLRVAQSVDGDATTFAWDWASGVPELLRQGETRYLVGHDTLGWHNGEGWTYSLPDALGSVRQATDATGVVRATREWTPFGVAVGGAQAGLGYTGEWFDDDAGLQYLRARWYDVSVGRFTRRDPWMGLRQRPQTSHRYVYATDNPVGNVDPSRFCSQVGWNDSTGLFTEKNCDRLESGDLAFTKQWYSDFADHVESQLPQTAAHFRHFLSGQDGEYQLPESFVEDDILGVNRLKKSIDKLINWYIRKNIGGLSPCTPTSVGPDVYARGFTPQYAQAYPILGPLFGTNELDIAGSLGSFRLDVELTGDLNRHSGWWTTKTDADLEVHVVVLDIYDWHAGLGVQWEGNGISDEWAQGLVDSGMAAIFLVRGDHTYTVKKTLSKPFWGVSGSPPSGWYWASYIGSQFEITSFTGGPERVDYEGNPMK